MAIRVLPFAPSEARSRRPLSVEIDHPPTPGEPITITRDQLRTFAPQFEVVHEELFGAPEDHNLHSAILSKRPYVPNHQGIYVSKMRRDG